MTRAEIIKGLKDIHIRFYAFTDYRKTLEACLEVLEDENALLDTVLKIIKDYDLYKADEDGDLVACRSEILGEIEALRKHYEVNRDESM